jgi:hypothetical protein
MAEFIRPQKRACMALLVLLSATPIAAQERTANVPCPAITTAGKAVVRAAPDRAFVTVTTETRAREPGLAQRQSASAMSSVQAKLKSVGVPADGIRTVHYDLQPEYDYVNGRQTLRGYVARNAVEVRIDDLTEVGAMIDAAVGAGASAVTGVRFALDKQEELEREALTQAVANARARASAAAAAAGVSIERIWSVIDRLDDRPPVPMMTVRAEAARDVPTPIAPGPIELHATVMLTACIR